MALFLLFAADEFNPDGLPFDVPDLDVDGAVHVLLGLMDGDCESLARSQKAGGFRRGGIDEEAAPARGRDLSQLGSRSVQRDSIFRQSESLELAAVERHILSLRHPERGACAFVESKDLGALIRAGARKARILICPLRAWQWSAAACCWCLRKSCRSSRRAS